MTPPRPLPRVHIGTYASAGGAGMRRLLRHESGDWSPGSVEPTARNASFAARSRRHGLHYLVDEADEGAINVVRESADGWDRVARVASEGALPCYLALDAGEQRLAVANYGDGSIAVFALDPAGLPMLRAVRRIDGRGPVQERQDGPHAHCVAFPPDGDALYHVDLGADRIYRHGCDPSGRLGDSATAYVAPPGSGPRHLALHPERPLALLVSELASTLTVIDLAAGGARGTVSTLPAGFAGESLGGQVSLNAAGDRIYVTNRGHDSVAVFAWDGDDLPVCLQHVASEGASPRAFALLEAERQLILANEEGGSVTVFDLVPDGMLARRATFALPGAAFVYVAA